MCRTHTTSCVGSTSTQVCVTHTQLHVSIPTQVCVVISHCCVMLHYVTPQRSNSLRDWSKWHVYYMPNVYIARLFLVQCEQPKESRFIYRRYV
jgi:hypothetical protein